MPLEAKIISSFETKLIQDPKDDNELQNRIASLFHNDKRFHDFVDGDVAIAHLKQIFIQRKNQQGFFDYSVYVGMFNDKPISAVIAQRVAEDVLQINCLVMHTANLNRGIEHQLLKLIKQQLMDLNIQISTKNKDIMKFI